MASKPAAASSDEAPIDLSAGYLYTRDITNKANTPKGFFFGVDSTGAVAIAGEVDGSFKNGAKMWSFLAGPRFNGKGGSAKAFGEILAGLSRASVSGLSSNAFTIAPGAGVDMTGSNSKVGARLQAAFDLNRANGVWSKGFTVGVGIVFGAGK